MLQIPLASHGIKWLSHDHLLGWLIIAQKIKQFHRGYFRLCSVFVIPSYNPQGKDCFPSWKPWCSQEFSRIFSMSSVSEIALKKVCFLLAQLACQSMILVSGVVRTLTRSHCPRGSLKSLQNSTMPSERSKIGLQLQKYMSGSFSGVSVLYWLNLNGEKKELKVWSYGEEKVRIHSIV